MHSKTVLLIVLLASLPLLPLAGCESEGHKVVVVYSSQDPEFAEPLLDDYAKAAGVEVEAKFDVESSKTVGLAQLLIRESPKPRCDLFWNNEILNTLRLREKGMLATWSPANAADIPPEFQGQGPHLVRLRRQGANPHRQHQAHAPRPTVPRAWPTCSTRGGRGRSRSPSRCSAPRPRTPPACSPPGATTRLGRSSPT